MTCLESESVFLDDLKLILKKQIEILKSNVVEFKTSLEDTYTSNEEVLHERISLLNDKIDALRVKINTLESKLGDSYQTLKNELKNELNVLMQDKQKVENELLTSSDASIMIKNTLSTLEKINDVNIEDTFRQLFKRMIVKNRLDLVFIVGNEDVTGLNLLDLPKKFTGKQQIKVRSQYYTVNFGIFINQ